jgi:hypothetical protein
VFIESLIESKYQREYLIVHHIPTIRSQHDEYCLRFAAAVNEVLYSEVPLLTFLSCKTSLW